MKLKQPIITQSILNNLSLFLVDPIHEIEDIDKLRLSRLLSSILIFTIALLFLLFLIRVPIGISTTFESLIRIFLIGVMVLAYVLVRTTHYWWSNIIIISSTTISLFVLAIVNTDAPYLEPLNYLIVIMLYSSLFLSLPITSLLFVIHLAGLLIIPLAITNVTLAQIISSPVSLYLTLGLFILIITIYRNKLETERKAQLIKDEQFLSGILNAVQDGISVVDRNLNILLSNQQMEKMFEHQIPPTSCQCGASSRYQTPYCSQCPTIRTLETGQAIREIVSYDPTSTQTEWMELSTFPMLNESGQIESVIEYVQDITERKQLERELIQHQEHLETLVEERTIKLQRQNKFIKIVLESLTYPFYVLNIDDYSLSIANETALQNRSIKGLTCYQLAHAQNAPCSEKEHLCPLPILKETKKPVRVEHEHVTSEGEVRIVEVYAYPIFDEDEQVKQVIEYTQDITEQKHIEQKLWESEHRYRSLFEAANDAIFILDLQGNHITANQRAAQMLGYGLDELNGLSYKDIVVLEEHHQSDGILRRLLAGESLAIYERWFRRKDGDVFPVEVNVLLVQDQTGKPLHIQSIVRDISHRKQAEQKLRSAYEQLKELDHLKDKFVSSVSHELRTPLTNLKLYHHLLTIQPAKLNEYLTVLQLQTTYLEKIVESMLYMLNIQQQLIRPEFVVLNLNDLVQKAVDAHQIYTQENVKTLVYQVYPKAVTILGDLNLLEQAISALLDNAIKYSPPQSLIQISIKKKDGDDREWIGVSISDTGLGVPIEDVPYIFERFFRGETALETGTPGAGLGLAIAQSIVEQHQGCIDVQNKETLDQGSVFSIWLPLYSAE